MLEKPDNLPPLVIVEGFLGSSSAFRWGNFETFLHARDDPKDDLSVDLNRRKVLFASVGPVSSLHDRACELYALLKGGAVDYGETHSREFGHDRFGRRHDKGLYPEWSSANPVHLLGHSIGGSTIVYLVWLIKTGFFGPDAHPDMILSVNTVSAPHRGTQAVYFLGESYKSAPAVRSLSPGGFLTRMVHLVSYFAPLSRYIPAPFKRSVLDLHAESRRLGLTDMSFPSFLSQLVKSDWAESKDAAPWDVTFEAAEDRDSGSTWGETNQRTFYRSYVACMTKRISPSSPHQAPPFSLSPLNIMSRLMGSFNFCRLQPQPSFSLPKPDITISSDPREPSTLTTKVDDIVDEKTCDLSLPLGEELWANDGVVPVFSQYHPGDCSSHHCVHYGMPSRFSNGNHPRSSEKDTSPTATAGIWHVCHLPEGSHHQSLIPVWSDTDQQRAFWRDMGKWLTSIEKTAQTWQ